MLNPMLSPLQSHLAEQVCTMLLASEELMSPKFVWCSISASVGMLRRKAFIEVVTES